MANKNHSPHFKQFLKLTPQHKIMERNHLFKVLEEKNIQNRQLSVVRLFLKSKGRMTMLGKDP